MFWAEVEIHFFPLYAAWANGGDMEASFIE
jgi:hypothetical protein